MLSAGPSGPGCAPLKWEGTGGQEVSWGNDPSPRSERGLNVAPLAPVETAPPSSPRLIPACVKHYSVSLKEKGPFTKEPHGPHDTPNREQYFHNIKCQVSTVYCLFYF